MPDADLVVQLLAVAISVFGAVLSFVFARASQRSQSEAVAVEKLHWAQAFIAEVRGWAVDVCDCLSQAVHLCDLDPARTADPGFFERRHRLLVQLSSLIDRGRWHFPNIPGSDFGDGREAAFRGFRDKTIDCIVSAYRVLEAVDYRSREGNIEKKALIVEEKKRFVSRIQEFLDPLHKSARVKEFLAEFTPRPRARA